MNGTTDMDRLRQEYRQSRIGPEILAETRRVVHQVVRRFDPEIYGGAATWDDAEEDVVQAVVLDLLLAEGQIDYLMATAVRLDDFRNLLRFQVRRYLARTRRRTVVDNLLDRAKEILAEPPFEQTGSAQDPRFRIPGSAVELREPTEEEILAASRAVALVPRTRSSDHDRAPVVYPREALATALEAIATVLPVPFSLSDVGRILELVLTDWVASFLYEFEEDQAVAAPSLGPEEETMAEEAAQRILERVSGEALVVLRRKLENVSDEEIARELGVSRPTVIARKRSALGELREALGGLPEHVQAAAMDQVSLRLATLEPGGSHASP